jgi:hypothetical protein
MKANPKNIQAYESVQPNSNGVRIEANQSRNETVYWGILCRACAEPVAFDICPYPSSFVPGAANVKAGTIRCGRGHNHIYFPRDLRFLFSVVPINDEVMQENREAYKAINPSSQVSYSDNRTPSEKIEALRREVEIFGDGDDLPPDEWKIAWESGLSHEEIMVKLNALRV